MLIKWIKCQVDEKDKIPFSVAQESWAELKKLEGFLGQIGGWDINNTLEAGIISFWKDSSSYMNFMEFHHDKIFETSNQKNTYKNISVNVYEKMYDIKTDISKVLGAGKLLRIAECSVNHFEYIQKEVWNKDMAASTGMLAGTLCKNPRQSENYLVASVWEDNHSHHRYVDSLLPSLRKRSGLSDPGNFIIGYIIEINPKWSVF